MPPTLLEELRVAGEKTILPDAATEARIRADQKTAVGSFKICIDETGEQTARENLQSTGYPAYDEEIEVALDEWRFEPYRVLDRPVPACTAVTFIYRPPPDPRAETPRERAIRIWDEEQKAKREAGPSTEPRHVGE